MVGTWWPILKHDFIIYDDSDYVTNNDHVLSGLNRNSIRWAFSNTETANWHPLTWLSHELDIQLYGLRPWGHHLTGLLLHTANTLLLFLFLAQATGARWRSFLAAALFGLHPIHIESVAWVAERKDVLSTFFFMLTLWAYCRFAELRRDAAPRAGKSVLWYCLALFFFALGLMSKQMLVTLPFVLLLLDYWPLRRIFDGEQPNSPARVLLEKIPFFILAAAASVTVFLVQRQGGTMSLHILFIYRLGNALVAYCRYLGKIFWPANLSIFYPFPGQPWPMGTVGLAALFLGAVTVAALVFGRKRSWLPVGWFWFIGTLVPVIGLVQVGEQSLADRYEYIPSIGIFLLVAWGVGELLARTEFRVPAGAGIAGLVIFACAAATRQELGYWQNGETLFRRALAVTEPNCISLTALGEELAAQGHFDEAIPLLQQAIKLAPDYVEPRLSLGGAFLEIGRLDDAMSQFSEAVRAKPQNADAHNGLGIILSRTGHMNEAIAEYQAALKADPGYGSAHANLGAALAKMERWPEAISEFQLAVKFNPDNPDSHVNLGVCLGKVGRLDEGISQFQEALRLQPGHPGAQQHLAEAQAAKAAQNK